MKKLIIIFSLLGISICSFGQTIDKWVDTDSLNTEKLVFKGRLIDSIFEDTVNYAAYSGHSVNADTAGYVISSIELADRTIYYSTTGSDETGDGAIGNPFATPLKCIQDIKDIVIGCTITVSGSGEGNFNITDNLRLELAKKQFINSILTFTGSTVTTIESGFTVATKPSRLFAYTLSKGGLTVTEDQYRDNFVTNTSESEFWPIAYNEAGSDAFEIEYVRASRTTMTKVISFGITWNDVNNLGNILDMKFGTTVNSFIIFEKMNFTFGTTNCLFQYGDISKEFNYCRFNMKGMEIGTTGATSLIYVRFNACVFNQIAANYGLIYIYGLPTQVNFTRSLFDAKLLSGDDGAIDLRRSSGVTFNNGNYIIGPGSTTGYHAIYLHQAPAEICINFGLKAKNFRSFAYMAENSKILISNTNNLVDVYYEFEDVTNLFGIIPREGVKLQIPYLYGSLPGNLIDGGGAYSLIDISDDIKINISGIPTSGTATLSSGTITVNTAAITDDSVIILTPQNAGTAQGSIYISARVAGTSFTITSTNGSDDRLVGWQIIK